MMQKAKIDWRTVRHQCNNAQCRGPAGSSPSALFTLEIVDLDDTFFMGLFLPEYEPLQVDMCALEREAAESVNRDGWLQWVRGEGAEPPPRSMENEQNWADWFFTSIDRWIQEMSLCGDAVEHLCGGSFVPTLCAPLCTALLRCDLFLQWRNRADAANIDTNTTADGDDDQFPDLARDWADAYVKAPMFHPVDIFFLKISLGRQSVQQRKLDSVKVVRMAARAAWRGLEDVLVNQCAAGLGCVSAHLYEGEDSGFFMDVYYVAFNAVHCCFESQRILSFRVPTGPATPENAEVAVYALTCYRLIAIFVQQLHSNWVRLRGYKLIQPSKRHYQSAPEGLLPTYAFLLATRALREKVIDALGDEFRIQGYLEDHDRYLLWQGIAKDGETVALKAQSNRFHLLEMTALVSLRGVPGVIEILRCYTVDSRQVVMVSKWLNTVNYMDMKRKYNLQTLRKFINAVNGILKSIHERQVYHRAINPRVFMVDDTGAYVLVDFTSAHVGYARPRSLCGNPAFVFPGTPLERAEQCDFVGFGGVLGWILGIPGFGCAGTSHAEAVRAAETAREQQTHDSAILQTLCRLLEGRAADESEVGASSQVEEDVHTAAAGTAVGGKEGGKTL